MAAPLTGAARAESWKAISTHLFRASMHSTYCVMYLDYGRPWTCDEYAARQARQAAHHANRALDLIAQLTADGRKDE